MRGREDEVSYSTRHTALSVRPAVIHDAEAILGILQPYVDEDIVLPIPVYRLYERIRDFVVAEQEGMIVGCGSLMIMWHDLAEIRSLAVRKGCQGGGVGRHIVDALIDEAITLGISKVFALTYETTFFVRSGFDAVEKETLPHKVWKDCTHCARFTHCDETPMARILIPDEQRDSDHLLPPMPPPDPNLMMPQSKI
ncbi:MAG: N-acetyltransferase [Candidatus Latescibacteria bacterium]|jgi:amino-acid N-acetyltransferase|nr:N-acetyltransferase [Candidatus Latescibacterota bacterium]